MKRHYIAFAAAAMAFGLCTETKAASLIVNGGFETGDLSGWTSQGWFTFSVLDLTGKSPSEGVFYATTGCVGDQCINGTMDQQAFLYQDIATLAGEQYALSFDLQGDEDPTELKVLFDGNTVFDLSGLGFQLGYTTYSGTFTASGTTTRLLFLGRDDPAFFGFDNVILSDTGIGPVVIDPGPGPTPSDPTPEPSTWVLACSGVFAAYRFRRR